MSSSSKRFRSNVSGLFRQIHRISGEEGELGQLEVKRAVLGGVQEASWVPVKGEKLLIRREPGLLRGQFSLWTEEGEWLASSLRWSFTRREINISTGSKALRLVPMPGLKRGWRVLAPRSGEIARMEAALFGRGAHFEQHRRLDFEVLLFAYFLGSQILWESLLPGPEAEQRRA